MVGAVYCQRAFMDIFGCGTEIIIAAMVECITIPPHRELLILFIIIIITVIS